MNTFDAISQRRSIRKFKDTPISDEIILKLLQAGIQAPSGKNRQPWRFIVVKQDKRSEMIRIMRAGIEKRKAQGMSSRSSEASARVMEQAPVTIFVFNAFEKHLSREKQYMDVLWNVVDVQSIGAAIQNMHLAAQDLCVGALWICDVFYADEELCEWLGETRQMVAAVSFGYANEQPDARPRKSVDEVTTWF